MRCPFITRQSLTCCSRQVRAAAEAASARGRRLLEKAEALHRGAAVAASRGDATEAAQLQRDRMLVQRAFSLLLRRVRAAVCACWLCVACVCSRLWHHLTRCMSPSPAHSSKRTRRSHCVWSRRITQTAEHFKSRCAAIAWASYASVVLRSSAHERLHFVSSRVNTSTTQPSVRSSFLAALAGLSFCLLFSASM